MLFDKKTLQNVVKAYKADFVNKQWPDEKYKWVAAKHFQDNWNIDAPDFASMLDQSLGETKNLLTSSGHFPKKMIVQFAREVPDEVRDMFRDLFEEKRDLWMRINSFKEQSQILLELSKSPDANKWKRHYQDENTIFTYLWLRYPEKYYIYKASVIKDVAQKMKSELVFKKGKYKENIHNFLELYNGIRQELLPDRELVDLLKSQLTPDCYPDEDLCTLTMDVGYYISRRYGKALGEDDWMPKDYSPNLSVSDWIDLLKDREVVSESALKVLQYMKEIGGQATCIQLADKFGGNWQFYNRNSSALGEKIIKKTKCNVPRRQNGTIPYWAVLYVGKKNVGEGDGVFTWKLRKELSEALDSLEFSDKYDKQDFLKEVFINEEGYDSLVRVLKDRKNIILQGAPGVGKTFAAKRLAYSIMGVKDESRIGFIQFHQNYSYEDFVMGYKPNNDGFVLKHGIFYEFCQKAANDKDREYFFIIDEINRGNMSKIFGELLMLIEKDYRDVPLALSYDSKSLFAVPENLYIIGMMNTADRSLAMIDYALRRRFSFFEMNPGFDSAGFIDYQTRLGNDKFGNLVATIKALNDAISHDDSLGKGFCIGHSYLCGKSKEECSEKWLQDVVKYDILPMIAEYWFDNPEECRNWSVKLMKAIE